MRILVALALSTSIALPLTASSAEDTSSALARAVASEHRSAQFVARDKYRHPQEVLEFIGVEPGMTVVEIWPGGGYWTEILGPYLREKGTYYTAVPARGASERAARGYENWIKKLEEKKPLYGEVKVTELGRGHYQIAPRGSADVVLTFRNVHNWMSQGYAEEAFKAFYDALKPGGILGVEEHRAPSDKPQDPKAASGYVREDYTIELAKKAGFELVDRSELLANPKDTKNWPRGVWTLPPTLALGDQDREKYMAIGEADNFLLKFRKPTSARKTGDSAAP
jgi:predicted methyltransferase